MSWKYFVTFCCICIFLCPQYQVHSAELSIVINEILPDPEGADAGKEWIEFKNLSNNVINLKGYRIENINLDSGSIRNINISEDLMISGNSLGIISEGAIADITVPQLVVGSGKLNLYNSKAKLVLYAPSGNVLHEFVYYEVKSGKSIESPGYPYCIKNVINESGSSVGTENLTSYTICSDTLQGSLEFSKDSQNWSSSIDSYSQQLYLRYKPVENIDITSFRIFQKVESDLNEIFLPLASIQEQTLNLQIKVTTSFTNLVYGFDEVVTIGKSQPKILFSFDNISWTDNIETSVKAGTLLYFKEASNNNVKIVLGEKEYESPLLITQDINSEISFSVGSETLSLETINVMILPELIITSAYPAPLSGEKEFLQIRNLSKYSINKDIYLTDNIDNPTQKEFNINLEGGGEMKIFNPPSLNNSGDEIYMFVDNKLVDHVIYGQVDSGDIFTRTTGTTFPVELTKPKPEIPSLGISDAKKLSKGSQVKVNGRVTYLDKSFAYLQDATGGIRISGSLSSLVEGRSYEVLGDISESLGERKIIGIESVVQVADIEVNSVELDTQKLKEQVGKLVHGTFEVLANYAKSFKIFEKVSISLTSYEGFDRSKGDTIRFRGILSKGSTDTFKIIPIELSIVESEVEGIQVSYPIAIIDPKKELTKTIGEIRSNGINSLVIGIGFVVIYFIFRFLKSKLDILMLKFTLWRESRKTQKSLSSERNTKSDTVSVSS